MRRRPYVIGVTGNIACGKSTVMRELGRLGADLIDADTVYHELIAPGRELNAKLQSHFGAVIAGADGSIDRRALAAIVFADPTKLAELDRLSHPAVANEIRRRVVESWTPVIAIDAVKLIESGLDQICDSVWLVRCDPDIQRQRLMARSNLSREDAERRIAAQPSLDQKRSRADLVLDNSGPLDHMLTQIWDAWRKLSI